MKSQPIPANNIRIAAQQHLYDANAINNILRDNSSTHHDLPIQPDNSMMTA